MLGELDSGGPTGPSLFCGVLTSFAVHFKKASVVRTYKAARARKCTSLRSQRNLHGTFLMTAIKKIMHLESS